MKDITQTREIVAALAACIVRYQVAKADDGKVSTFEALGFLKEIPRIKEAIDGAGEVIGELADLDALEVGELKVDISALLVNAGLSHRTADITEEVLQAAFDLARAFLRIKNMPPVAVAA